MTGSGEEEPEDGVAAARGSGDPLAGLGDLLGEARGQFDEAAERAAEQVVTGQSAGGAVEVRLNGNLEALSVTIDPAVVDPADVAMLEDLVLAALRDALSQAVDVRERTAASLLPPGLDLGSLMGNLFGESGGYPDLSGLELPGGLPDLSELMGGLFGTPPSSGDEESPPDGSTT